MDVDSYYEMSHFPL